MLMAYSTVNLMICAAGAAVAVAHGVEVLIFQGAAARAGGISSVFVRPVLPVLLRSPGRAAHQERGEITHRLASSLLDSTFCLNGVYGPLLRLPII
ncbi:hypothetical protein AV530_002291 [Patagioenas fasciata monilis]|uniref:Secreted protein n=1 Tax=Patagioenas fasciata monilis TaxID=372326 RepID=A0A1V4K635_PATFA|nr:hypothetical protein AV530_002291 [Patagioenas fasciata monilis]